MADKLHFDAVEMLRAACERHTIDLAVLVAETAIWANPEVHRRLLAENGTGAYFPGVRRARLGAGEVRGKIVSGDSLDDNTRANQAIKRAVGVSPERIKGFETCHLWPGTAYDSRYHTVIANLVLIPRSLAGLSDHDAEVLVKLQYRAFELYGWHPLEVAPPKRPLNYPTCWREPEPFTSDVAKAMARRFKSATSDGEREEPSPRQRQLIVGEADGPDLPVQTIMPPDEWRSVISKVRRWAAKPDTIAHRTIGLIIRAEVPQARQRLAQAVEEATGSTNGSGVVASLLTSKGNSYGRVLIDRDGMIGLHPDVAEEIRRHHWA